MNIDPELLGKLVTVELNMTFEQAALLAVQPQHVMSNRMAVLLDSVLTDEQKIELAAGAFNPRPMIFPSVLELVA